MLPPPSAPDSERAQPGLGEGTWAWEDGLTWRALTELSPPSVVDSWLIDEGRVRGLADHEARFAAAARGAGLSDDNTVGAFLHDVRRALPRRGRWFPRVEARTASSDQLVLCLRPAPVRSRSVVLWIPPSPDPRGQPRVKGPDLGVLAALQESARSQGGEDALLYTPDRMVIEAGSAAVVWWRDGALHLPPPDLPRLPSVTASLLVDLAHWRGVAVNHDRLTIDEVEDVDLWTANSLHGIRPVTGYVRDGQLTVAARRGGHTAWQAALDRLGTPLGPQLGDRGR
jgi:branched-subunit amino acid aminotransferase/4-amino-4-deoxychorismate lyase